MDQDGVQKNHNNRPAIRALNKKLNVVLGKIKNDGGLPGFCCVPGTYYEHLHAVCDINVISKL